MVRGTSSGPLVSAGGRYPRGTRAAQRMAQRTECARLPGALHSQEVRGVVPPGWHSRPARGGSGGRPPGLAQSPGLPQIPDGLRDVHPRCRNDHDDRGVEAVRVVLGDALTARLRCAMHDQFVDHLVCDLGGCPLAVARCPRGLHRRERIPLPSQEWNAA